MPVINIKSVIYKLFFVIVNKIYSSGNSGTDKFNSDSNV